MASVYDYTAALTNAAVNLGTTAASLSVGSSLNKRNRQFVEDMNRQNHEWALEQNEWNDQKAREYFDIENEYNLPSNIRKRIEDAGYNPAILNGDFSYGDITTPQSSNLATNQIPTINDPSAIGMFNQGLGTLTNIGMDYLRAKQIQKETDKVTAEIPQIQEMTNKIVADTHLSEEQAKIYAVQIDKVNQDIQQSRQYVELMKKQGQKIEFDILIGSKQIDIQEKLCYSQLEKTLSDIGVNKANIQKIAQEIVNLDVQALKTGREISALDLNNIYQAIVNKYAENKELLNQEEVKSQIYSSCTSVVSRTLHNFTDWIDGGLQKIKPSIEKTTGGQIMDRINNKGGFSNQE